MTREFEVFPLFDGYRGTPAVDREAVVEVIVTIGDLLDNTEIHEIDPLLAQLDRAVGLDAVISLDD